MAYYKVMVEFKQVFELLIKAKDLKEAREKARDNWGEDDPIFSDIEVFDVVELGEKQ